MRKKLTNRERAYRLVELELRKLDINDAYFWRDTFYLADGSPCDVTVQKRGDARDYTAGGIGLMAAVDAERARQRRTGGGR